MQVFSFLLSSTAFLLIVFALRLLYTRQGNTLLNRLLALQLFTRFGQIAIFLLLLLDDQHVYPVFQSLLIPFLFFLPACSYLYVRCFISGESRLRRIDYWHLIPMLLAIVHVVPWVGMDPVDWTRIAKQILHAGQFSIASRTGFFAAFFYSVVLSLLTLGYLIATWYIVLSSHFILRHKWDGPKTWLFFYMAMATSFKLLSFVPLLFNHFGKSYAANPAFLMMSCLLLLFMMVFVLYQPRILYGYVLPSNWEEGSKVVDSTTAPKKTLATKNKLTDQQQQIYAASITKWMDEELPFLAPDFQMIHLAQQLQLPVHYCSQTINNVMERNFRDWLNSYRIRYFVQNYPILCSKMTIEAIAYQSGFKNMTTFYNAFKKETGQMPTAYFS